MALLDEAKDHLGINGTDEDAKVQRLVNAAVEYLSKIGVVIGDDPMPWPVRQAALLLVENFNRDHTVETDHIVGLGGMTYRPNRSAMDVVDMLVAPYREVNL